jgi:hypothetical protein
MEKKYYQIVAKTPEDWEIIHNLLITNGTLEDNVPSHSCECVDDKLHSPTRSTYLLTDDEANALKNHPSLAFINVDGQFHPEYAPPVKPAILRHDRNVKNYRSLKQYGSDGSPIRTVPPAGDYDGRYSGEFYRTGYQILRGTSRTNPWGSDSTEVLNRDINYSYDGSDVDLVIVDNGVFYGHPEFMSDEYDPPNYIRGNVLSRSGQCGVLDMILDAPYYLDPDYFNANSAGRLTRRWDGTLVPIESVARDWWYSSSNRSTTFNNNRRSGDFSINIVPDYTRAANCGADRTTSPSNDSEGDHGTPCASLAYGKNFGWAFNSNKWSITVNLGNSNSIDAALSFDIQKIFHLNKPVNPKFNSRNPTVSSNSWSGVGASVPNFQGRYSYQNGSEVTVPILSSIPFLQVHYNSFRPNYDENAGFIVAGREMVDSGVFFFNSAGNDNRYIASPTDPNFNNYYAYERFAEVGTFKDYAHRSGWPGQIGHRTGENVVKSFMIGAIDDGYTGDYPSETNYTYLAAGSGKEKLARSQYSNSKASQSYEGDYSAKGTGVDFYAPADGTLAASSDITQQSGDLNNSKYQNPYQLSSSMRYNDQYFNGTSAACPVAAGLAACMLQNNRDLSIVDFKTYLKNNIQDQTNFFIGNAPTGPLDVNWQVPFSTMGTPVKIIYEITTTSRTPNPTFTSTFGITSGSANERFTLNHNASLQHTFGIYGVKMFDSRSDNNGFSLNLSVTNGYYYVGSRDFSGLSRIAIRVDPTNNKKVQFSDSNGEDSWDDMEITVQNGQFQQIGSLVYYVFSGGSGISGGSSSTNLSSISSPTISGSPGSVNGSSLRVYGAITAGGDVYGLLSDDRVKENQRNIDNAIEKLESLNGFTYNFNETGEKLGFDPNQRHSGVSAQDVQNVLPESVAPAPADNNYLTVKYDKLIPLLIESIKDLKNDLDDLKNSK